MSIRTIRVLVMLLALTAGVTHAQSLDESLQKLAGSAGKAYISPIVTNLGVNLNTGWMNRAPERNRLGFDLEFGMVGMLSDFGGVSEKTFSLSSGFRFSKSQAEELTIDITDADIRNQVIAQITQQDLDVTIAGATIAGSAGDRIKVLFSGKTFTVNSAFPVEVTLPPQEIDLGVGGLMGGLESLPSVAPQLKLGTLFGTRAILRMLPEIKLGDSVGNFSYFGFGLEHNVTYWLDFVPLDINAGFLTQTAKIGNSVKFMGATYGLNVSKKFGFWLMSVTPYAGLALESSTLSVNLTQKIETTTGTQETKIAFDAEGAGKSRFSAGAYIKLFLLRLNLEYSAAKVNTMSASMMFNF